MQRILITAVVAIILIGTGVFIYFYFFAQKPTINVAPGGVATLPIAGPSSGGSGGEYLSLPDAPTPVTTRLMKISKGPVVQGSIVVATPVASSSPEISVKYIERRSGNVFVFNPKTSTITRTNNQTVPGIQSAVWIPDGTMAFVRYLSGDTLNTINTYGLPASADDSQGGFFLSQNISDITVSSSSILTLASGVSGSVALLGNIKDSRTTELFSSPLSSLRISFAGKSRYLAYTKPSSALPGFAFLVDNSGFSRIAGPNNGLTALISPSGRWLLVSYFENNTMRMNLVDSTNGDSVTLPVATIAADKCVWADDSTTVYCGIPTNPPTGYAYPDDWYQGAIAFSDRIWKIEAEGRYAQLVLDFSKETSESLDAISLAIDPLDTTLVFTNKNDESFWSYQL
jgi:hypothetical protein